MPINYTAGRYRLRFHTPGNPAAPDAPDPNQPQRLQKIGARQNAGSTVRPRVNTIAPAPRVVASAGICSCNEWYVNQIWTLPQPVDFGGIIGQKNITVAVLNTFRDETRSLASIDLSALGAGLSISAGTPPLILKPFTSLDITFTASSSGAPSFDNSAEFVWDHRTIPIRFIGRRLVLVPFVPETPIGERLAWVTDVLKARSGKEQRQSLRTSPRQVIKMRYSQDDDVDASKLRTMLASFQPSLFGIPVWWEAQLVTSAAATGQPVVNVNTLGIDHRVNSSVMVLLPDKTYFDAQVNSIAAGALTLTSNLPQAVPLGSYVIPIRFAYILGSPSYTDSLVGDLNTEVEFETTDNIDLSSIDVSFARHPIDNLVVMSDPNFTPGNQQGWAQNMDFQRLDNEIGVPAQYPTETLADPYIPKGVTFENDLAKIRKWRALLHYLRGSYQTFYLPTFRNDLPLSQNMILNSSTFTAKNTGAAQFVGVKAPRRDVFVTLSDGRTFVQRVAAIVDNGATETFTLSGALAPGSDNLAPKDVRISWCHLVRLRGDVATFEHKWPGYGTLLITTVGVQNA